jgi:hypothetical protein
MEAGIAALPVPPSLSLLLLLLLRLDFACLWWGQSLILFKSSGRLAYLDFIHYSSLLLFEAMMMMQEIEGMTGFLAVLPASTSI